MESVILLLLGLIGIAVAYLMVNQRNFQRIDYSRILEQDDYIGALDSRIAYLEDMIAMQRAEHEAQLTELRQSHAASLEQLRSELSARQTTRPEPAPADNQAAAAPQRSATGRPRPNAPVPPRQQRPVEQQGGSTRQNQIAALLEQGVGQQDVASRLSVSRQEVEMVATLLFSRSAQA